MKTITQEIRTLEYLSRLFNIDVEIELTGLPRHICKKRIVCCQGVKELRFTVVNPVTVMALTELKSESM
jgi:hypothetical protein